MQFSEKNKAPNIVQYLGSYQDPETQLPVLLMELMDDSLTRFLERSQQLLPYHTQINICYDIALALTYLHSNDIIHRDLSSNNVFLIGAGNRAKITDFGMAKLFNINRATMTPLTMCPGTKPYMSPEALDDPPVYTKKLDTFSFGVLGIQIMTRQFPDPGPRTKKVQDPRDPKRRLQELVLETERRKSHIDLIDPTHPLLLITIDCLTDNGEDRPSAQELCHRLAALKEAPQYGDGLQQAQERSRPIQSVTEDREGGERQIREMRPEKELQQQLEEYNLHPQVSDSRIQKDAVVYNAARQVEIQEETGEKDHSIEIRTPPIPSDVEFQQREKVIQELQKENLQLRKELQEKDKVLQQKATLRWKPCKAAPTTMHRGSATVCGSIAYFKPDGSNEVHSYDSDKEKWSTLPECPTYYFTLTVVNGLVTAVGGSEYSWSVIENLTNTLLSLTESGWEKHFPPMQTKRKLTAVVCIRKTLVVAGGVGERTILTTVEVMNTDILQWSTVSSLPQPIFDITATICGDRVCLVGGHEEQGPSVIMRFMITFDRSILHNYDYSTKSVFTCSLSALLTRPAKNSVWDTITDFPVRDSTCVTLNGQLLAVGGRDSHNKDTNNIYSYDTKTNSWEVISHMPTPRHNCLVTVLPGNKLMVVGGCYMSDCIVNVGLRDNQSTKLTKEPIRMNNVEIAITQ